MLLSTTRTFQTFFSLFQSIKISWFFSFLLPQLIHQISKSYYARSLVPKFLVHKKSFFAIAESCNSSGFGICTTFSPHLSRNMVNLPSCPAQSVQESDRKLCLRQDRWEATTLPTLLEGKELTDQHFFPCSCHLFCGFDGRKICRCLFYKL